MMSSPGNARNNAHRAVAGELLGLVVASLKDGEGDRLTPSPLQTAPRSAARPVSALPVPLGDPRSSILGDPTARMLPEMSPERPGIASEALLAGSRSENLLDGL